MWCQENNYWQLFVNIQNSFPHQYFNSGLLLLGDRTKTWQSGFGALIALKTLLNHGYIK